MVMTKKSRNSNSNNRFRVGILRTEPPLWHGLGSRGGHNADSTNTLSTCEGDIRSGLGDHGPQAHRRASLAQDR